jgi:hypothetical protein
VKFLILALLLSGCATTKAVGSAAKQCEPTTAQETQLLTAASNPDELVALALIDALPFAVCVVQKLADKFITDHQQTATVVDAGSITADLIQASGVDAIRMRNLMDWRAEHP